MPSQRAASRKTITGKPAAVKRAAAKRSAPKGKSAPRQNSATKRSGPVDSLMDKWVPDLPFLGMVRDLGRWADTVITSTGATAKVASMVSPLVTGNATSASLKRAGEVLHDVRETAGLSIRDLGEAIDLKDETLLAHFEAGKVALPFDVILRIAAVLGRNDPIPFVMRLLRESNPRVARTLEDLGIGKLVVHVGREREFINLYRGKDELRALSEAEFAALLRIVEAAIGMAMTVRRQAQAGASKPPRRARPAAKR